MMKNEQTKRAALGSAKTENGKSKLKLLKYNISQADCQKDFTWLTSALSHGERNAISASDLCEVLGLSDTRNLRFAISEARMKGELILSTSAGYFLPDNENELKRKEEINHYIKAMSSRAICSFRAISAAKRAIGVPSGQLTIEDIFSEAGSNGKN